MNDVSFDRWTARVSGALLIIGGGTDLIGLGQSTGELTPVVAGLCALLGVAGISVGVGQLEGKRISAKFAQFLWAVQAVFVAVPHLSYQVVLGAKVQMVLYSTLTMQAEAGLGSVITAHVAPTLDRYYVGLNLLALTLAILSRRQARMWRA